MRQVTLGIDVVPGAGAGQARQDRGRRASTVSVLARSDQNDAISLAASITLPAKRGASLLSPSYGLPRHIKIWV